MEEIRWEIESKCNLKCKHCFVGELLHQHSVLRPSEAIHVIDKLAAKGLLKVAFTAKEPLLFNGIYQLIKHCHDIGLYTVLITNGTLLADHREAEALINTGINNISISLEGISERSNDFIRGRDVLNRVIDAFENIELYQPFERVTVGAQISLNRLSAEEVLQIPQFFNQLPLDFLYIGELLNDGNAKDYPWLRLNNKEFFEAETKLIVEYNGLSDKNYYLVPKSMLPWEAIYYNLKYSADFPVIPAGCGILEERYSLLPNGEMVPCISLLDHKNFTAAPSVNIVDSLWNHNEQFQAYKDSIGKIIKSKQTSLFCNECSFLSVCNPCPNSLMDDGFIHDLNIRCSSYNRFYRNYMDHVIQNGELSQFRFRKETFIKLNNGAYILRRIYPNSAVVKHSFTQNQAVETMINQLCNGNLDLKELSDPRALDFIEDLIRYNFITAN